jgi:hypothetical protein
LSDGSQARRLVAQRIPERCAGILTNPFRMHFTVHDICFGRPFGAIEFRKALDVAKQYQRHTWVTGPQCSPHRFSNRFGCNSQ